VVHEGDRRRRLVPARIRRRDLVRHVPERTRLEYGVFTANVFAADGTYFLFYSGVPSPFSNAYETATPTAIGMAESDSPDGPWRKLPENPVLTPQAGEWDDFRIDDLCPVEYEDNPLIWPGHEVTVWPTGEEIAALVNDVGLWSSPDGIDFEWRVRLTETPRPPGVYRKSGTVDWGIAQTQNIENTTDYYDESNTVYLQRFDCDLSLP